MLGSDPGPGVSWCQEESVEWNVIPYSANHWHPWHQTFGNYDYYTNFVLLVQMTLTYLMHLVVQGHKIEPF